MANNKIVYTRLFHICDLILLEFIKQKKHSLLEEAIRKVALANPGEYYACEAKLSKDGYLDIIISTQPAITPLGEFFIQNGGYKKKLEDEAKKEQYAASQHLFNKLIVYVTIAIGAATFWQACGQDIKSALQKKQKTSTENIPTEKHKTPLTIKDDSASLSK